MSAPARPLAHLLAITGLPSASGQEWRIATAIRRWAATHPHLAVDEDPAGNLVVRLSKYGPAGTHAHSNATTPPPPLFITAHLDHPGFVIERIDGSEAEVSFRGGVMPDFFVDAPITLFTRADRPIRATLTGQRTPAGPFGDHYAARIDDPSLGLAPGDVGRFAMPGPELDEQTRLFHTPACDDLACVAAAMEVMDRLLDSAEPATLPDTRLLFTRAEEIGFIGAIAATKHRTIPTGSLVLALENSRSFADSPIGGGPIVRVGDRVSVFDPWLTGACADRAEKLFGGASSPTAQQKAAASAKRPWQRKLMAGGACEATVFCAAGYAATCLCLPLGNYHNMPHLAELQAGTYDSKTQGAPRAAREFIHLDDYLGLVDLLVDLGRRHPARGEPGFLSRIEDLWTKKASVLQS